MMIDKYFNPFQSLNDPDQYKGLSDEERIRMAAMQTIGYIAILVIGLLLCALFGSCTTQKVIEQHHHHTYQADTLAMQAAIDSRLSSWNEQMDSTVKQAFQQYSSEWFSHEDEKETVTETVTSWVDSLGRQMRQEQRTTERTFSREQQQREQQLTREFESRLQSAIQHQDSIWQLRYQQLKTHLEQSDSTSSTVQRGSASLDNRPWYKRWWDHLRFILLGAAIATALYIVKRFAPWKK